jgi:prefoldin subunit 5
MTKQQLKKIIKEVISEISNKENVSSLIEDSLEILTNEPEDISQAIVKLEYAKERLEDFKTNYADDLEAMAPDLEEYL